MSKDILQRYQKAKAAAERFRDQKVRAEGALEEALKQLKDEFNCDSLKEAKVLLKKLRVEADKAEDEFEEALESFEKEWGETIG